MKQPQGAVGCCVGEGRPAALLISAELLSSDGALPLSFWGSCLLTGPPRGVLAVELSLFSALLRGWCPAALLLCPSLCLHALSPQDSRIPHLVTFLLAPSCTRDSELGLFSFPASVSTQSPLSCSPVRADAFSGWEANTSYSCFVDEEIRVEEHSVTQGSS